jgi:hypothetical protein
MQTTKTNQRGAIGALLIGALALGVISFALLFTGCKASQQRVAFNTLYSVEKATTGAYDGYIGSVLKGASTTNGVPAVSRAYNKFQSSFVVALDAVQFNTNALAPASLVVESQDVINAINTWRNK